MVIGHLSLATILEDSFIHRALGQKNLI